MQQNSVLDNDSKLSLQELQARKTQYNRLTVLFGLAALGGLAALVFIQTSMLRSQSAVGFESFALYYAVVALLTSAVFLAVACFWTVRCQYVRHLSELNSNFIVPANHNLRNTLVFSTLCVLGFPYFLQAFINYLQKYQTELQETVVKASLVLLGGSVFFIIMGLIGVWQWLLYMDFRVRQYGEPSRKIGWARRCGLISIALSAAWIVFSVMGKGERSIFYFVQFSDENEVLGFGLLAASCVYAFIFGALSLWMAIQTYFFYNKPE